MKISCAIATYNEEENIGKCLETVLPLVDEIVIVDGSSGDNTVKIARKLGARVLVCDNPEMFHINKQKALEMCKGEWIFQLDADETVSDELKKEIRKAVLRDEFDGYYLPRKNFFLGKFLSKGGQYPDYSMRLYKNGKAYLPCKSVHEQAVLTGKEGYLKNPLHHFPYPDFSHYLSHFNRYTTIFASEFSQDKVGFTGLNIIRYFFIKPVYWFLSSYIRHRGYVDGFAGFVFCVFSAMRYPVSFVKYWEMKKVIKTK